MIAATVTFTVTELAIVRAHDVEAKTRQGIHHRVMGWIARTFSNLVCGFIESKARQLAEQAVWFQGAIVTLEHERMNAYVDLDDRLVKALEDLEKNLLSMRASALEFIAEQQRKKHPSQRHYFHFQNTL